MTPITKSQPTIPDRSQSATAQHQRDGYRLRVLPQTV